MPRVIGLCAGIGLVAASLWFANLGEPWNQAAAQPDKDDVVGWETSRPEDATSRPAPRTGLLDRQPSRNEYKQVAIDLLQKARETAADGNLSDARRLALRAKAFDVVWNENETSPTQFLAQLTPGRATGSDPIARSSQFAQPGQVAPTIEFDQPTIVPGEPKRYVSPRTLAEAGIGRAEAESSGFEFDEPTVPVEGAGNPADRARAKKLLTEAHIAMDSANFETARNKVREAGRIDVEYGLFDERPELVMAKIDRLERANGGRAATSTTGRFTDQAILPAAEFADNAPAAAVNVDPTMTGTKADALALLAEARRDLAAGRDREAREKAQTAGHMEVTYGLFDDRPELVLADVNRQTDTAFIASAAQPVQRPTVVPPTNTIPETNGFDPSEPNPFETTDTNSPRMIEAAKPAAPPVTQGDGDRQQALAMLAAARAHLEQGDFETARQKAAEAEKVDTVYGLFDDRPELVLADVDSAIAAANIARTEPSAVAPRPATAGDDRTREAVAQLLQSAREDLQAGRYDRAEEKARAAEKQQVAYGLFDDRPELVLADIGRVSGTNVENIAGVEPAPTTPEEPAFEPPRPANVVSRTTEEAPADTPERRAALALLAEARRDLANGDHASARRKAHEAESAKVVYGLFDDRPELVLADVDRTFEAANIASSEPVPNREPAMLPSNDRARQLLAEARTAMQDGNLELAAARAGEASQIKTAWGIFEDTPQRVMEEIAEKSGAERPRDAVAAADVPEMTPPSEIDTPREITAPDLAGADRPADETTAMPTIAAPDTAERELPLGLDGPLVAAGPEFDVVDPRGPSADDLYEQGVAQLRSGDANGAYRAFLAAHESGQRMSPSRHQQLQDFLRELAPRNRGTIELVSDERVEAFGPGAGARGQREPGLVDEAVQKQAVEFDRLRSVTLNAVFKAEKMKEKDPEGALDVLDEALANVDESSLPETSRASLVASLRRTRSSIESWKKVQEPILALKVQNAEVLDQIKRDRKNSVRIESEFAELVKQFNDLMRQRRYAEAEAIAKQARELDEENPVGETLFWKARFARRIANMDSIDERREEGNVMAQQDIFESAIINVGNANPMAFPKNWAEMSERRKGKYGTDARTRTEQEKKIEQSLGNTISLKFDQAPLGDVLAHIRATTGINIAFDELGLADVGVDSSTPVTIDAEGIMLKSALNIILENLELGYLIQDEVLKITSTTRQQGKLVVATYPVADLVVPIPNFTPTNAFSQNHNANGQWGAFNGSGNYSVPAGMGGAQRPAGQAFFQVGDSLGRVNNPFGPGPAMEAQIDNGSKVDFDSLIDLITSTVEPSSWAEFSGAGSMKPNETTLSLVIRQTQAVHDEIGDLLTQLRRLQDLQVTVEIRFITIADQFFERIGVDFDFDVQDTVGDLAGTPPFGTSPTGNQQGNQGNQQGNQGQQGGQAQQGNVGVGGIGGGAQGQQGAQAGNAGGATGFFFDTPVPRALPERDNYPKTGTIVGLSAPGQFTSDLDVGFRQGSFQIGVPDFGGFNPDAGIQVGMAILSDIEAFLFIQAAQGDERSNIMFAPKVTLFNGQTATVSSNVQRPFVTSVVPTVGVFAVGFTPIITVLAEGVTVTVQAVISADRRFVRLTVAPSFNTITDVFAFSFQGGGGAGAGIGGALGGQVGGQQGGQIGGQLGGQQGGLGGMFGGQGGQFGGQGGQGGQVGFGGIGGGLTGGNQGNQGGQGGQGNQQGNQQGQNGGAGGGQSGAGGAAGTVTVQQPVFEVVNVTTTVSVPDGGTVLLAGVKRLREGRTMAGVPILNKIPYVSRLFKNTGVGRDTVSLMLMVTPRIIIQEEEEDLLGIEL